LLSPPRPTNARAMPVAPNRLNPCVDAGFKEFRRYCKS
jgi:hypothetical protein